MSSATLPCEVRLVGRRFDGVDQVLTPAALDFLRRLHVEFAARRQEELDRRFARSEALADGEPLGFLPETRAIREDPSWQIAPPAPGLVDRRVEITGPPDRKMAVNALNSGAKTWMADLEDACSPTWDNVIGGQVTLRDAVDETIDFVADNGKRYRIGEDPATILVRPRGWHLVEAGLEFCGQPASASLVDFGLYAFHCAQRQIDRGQGPYFYLPKLQSHHEARLWNDVFRVAQDQLGIPHGTIRATVLIETLPAAFEMDEILYELREHSAGLNAGRWDYLFSVIKTLGRDPAFVLPDRAQLTMTVPFMRAYAELLVRTCHRRGAHAIGGMAAFIPSRDAAVNEHAIAKVAEDKRREAGDGFDGSWVAHPGLVETCRAEFDAVLGDRPNQLDRQRGDVEPSAAALLAVDATPGTVTEAGLRNNVAVALRYMEAWLRGNGAVAIFDLMEDAATAEISRCQLWQWIRHGTELDDGRVVTRELVAEILDEERAAAVVASDDAGDRFDDARQLVADMALGDRLCSFFTPHAYRRYLAAGG